MKQTARIWHEDPESMCIQAPFVQIFNSELKANTSARWNVQLKAWVVQRRHWGKAKELLIKHFGRYEEQRDAPSTELSRPIIRYTQARMRIACPYKAEFVRDFKRLVATHEWDSQKREWVVERGDWTTTKQLLRKHFKTFEQLNHPPRYFSKSNS